MYFHLTVDLLTIMPTEKSLNALLKYPLDHAAHSPDFRVVDWRLDSFSPARIGLAYRLHTGSYQPGHLSNELPNEFLTFAINGFVLLLDRYEEVGTVVVELLDNDNVSIARKEVQTYYIDALAPLVTSLAEPRAERLAKLEGGVFGDPETAISEFTQALEFMGLVHFLFPDIHSSTFRAEDQRLFFREVDDLVRHASKKFRLSVADASLATSPKIHAAFATLELLIEGDINNHDVAVDVLSQIFYSSRHGELPSIRDANFSEIIPANSLLEEQLESGSYQAGAFPDFAPSNDMVFELPGDALLSLYFYEDDGIGQAVLTINEQTRTSLENDISAIESALQHYIHIIDGASPPVEDDAVKYCLLGYCLLKTMFPDFSDEVIERARLIDDNFNEDVFAELNTLFNLGENDAFDDDGDSDDETPPRVLH
ncbi:hypothetical protein AGMMS50289_21890 [Betaproteobacteria bacterium]|nr:hypothetical protein AGMMS50289_21890 [Betaproteobacteria bacterium]